MGRTRRAAVSALSLLFVIGAARVAAIPWEPSNTGVAIASAVTWPPSTGLLLAEVVTGGTSASDEYVEITNGGSSPADLAGFELVYVTSTGATITRKAAWTSSVLLEPGRHLLVANAAGTYAAIADVTYTGGLAATGGALVLRPIGGAPIDAVGWGDATNEYVEGTPLPAPPARASIERNPGGLGGNTHDTNDNAADWLVQGFPAAQNLAAPPAPAPTITPTPGPTSSPTAPAATPTPGGTPGATATTGPGATPVPTIDPGATATPDPSLPIPKRAGSDSHALGDTVSHR